MPSLDRQAAEVEASLRASLQALVPGLAEDAGESLKEALKAKKTVRQRVACRKCGHAEMVSFEIADAVASTQALKVAVELAEGRSGTADVQSGGVVVREIGPREVLEELNAYRARFGDLPEV